MVIYLFFLGKTNKDVDYKPICNRTKRIQQSFIQILIKIVQLHAKKIGPIIAEEQVNIAFIIIIFLPK